MPTIQQWSQALQKVEQHGGYLDINQQGNIEIKGTGFFEKITSWFRGAGDIARTHERVMHAFVGRLQEEYGEDFVDQLPGECFQTPLSSRLVVEMKEAGEKHRQMFQDLNQIKIHEFGGKTETFTALFQEVAKHREIPLSLDDVNTEKLQRHIAHAIQAAGQGGLHAVSTQEAYRIAEDAIGRFLEGKMALCEQIDSMDHLPAADRKMLREMAMNHDLSQETLTFLAEHYGEAAEVMRSLATSEGGDTRRVLLAGIKRLETLVLGAGLMNAGVDTDPLQLLMQAGLAFANRDYDVQPDAVFERLSAPSIRELRGALSTLFTVLDDDHAQIVLGGCSVQVETLIHVFGEASGLSVDQIEEKNHEMPAFQAPEEVPGSLAADLSDHLGVTLSRPSGLNRSESGQFSRAFAAKVTQTLDDFLARYVPDPKRFDANNIDKELIRDLARTHRYTFGGQSYVGKDSIEAFTRDINKQFSPEEVRILTAVTHQGLGGPFFSSLFEGLGPFKVFPLQSKSGGSSFDHNFSRDAEGNLIIGVHYRIRTDSLDLMNGNSHVSLDPSKSHYDFSFSFRISAESIRQGAPRAQLLDPILFDYAFHEDQALVGENPQKTGNEKPEEVSERQKEGLKNEEENRNWALGITQQFGNRTPNIDEFLLAYGYEFKKTPGDGHCFYNSIRHVTQETRMEETRSKVHDAVAHFLGQLKEDEKIFYEDLQDRFNRGYIKNPPNGPDAYGRSDECPAIALAYQRPVVVIKRTASGQNTLDLKMRPVVYEADGTQRDMVFGEPFPQNAIVLIHDGGIHWDGAVNLL